MHSAALLEKEVSDLRAENEKKKQKRTRSTRTIVHEGDLSVQDVRELRSEPFEAQVARINNYQQDDIIEYNKDFKTKQWYLAENKGFLLRHIPPLDL
ncbi:hypothetical protein PENVUL_c054G01322 [Penicillium vulpinum]|uniref:Uncharacterized protein n=1 Tax=Penicillium vulpinum TaxID=29845 RepID=A0A1V6RFA6_9EURO|nr:hypothetical protein PENVUL_c054G01322 [Penicillium vulpinum]